jgi:hypothetical protein
LVSSICLCHILPFSFIFSGCDQYVDFRGTETKEDNLYIIDFQILNSSRSHDMNLHAGDTIDVHVIKEFGSCTIYIECFEWESYFVRFDVSTIDYVVPITETGSYHFCVEGNNATGYIKFKVRE